jgi:hypothetical protein
MKAGVSQGLITGEAISDLSKAKEDDNNREI